MYLIKDTLLFGLISINLKQESERILEENKNYYLGKTSNKFAKIVMDFDNLNGDVIKKIINFLNLPTSDTHKQNFLNIMNFFGYNNFELTYTSKIEKIYRKLDKDALDHVKFLHDQEAAKAFITTKDQNIAILQLKKFNSGTNIKHLINKMRVEHIVMVTDKIKMISNNYFNLQLKDHSIKLSKSFKKYLGEKYRGELFNLI